jgi:nitrite reductase/ring-hydroxylating ferredoxin subunit
MLKFVSVAKKSEIPDQSAKCVQAEGKSITLFNLGGQFYATDDTCSHVGGPLSGGLSPLYRAGFSERV